MTHPIQFEPIFMERVWGGRELEARFQKPLPHGQTIGEIWELVDRPEAQSVVHSGEMRGCKLHDLWTSHREKIFGRPYASHPAGRFPLLIKLLDARSRLSVQVHPPAAMAPALNGEPKTEMWYFAHCDPGAVIFAGLKSGVDRARFERSLHDDTVENCLHAVSVHDGESIFIPSGRLHAIGEGNVIVEVQQNSDTTYRVFDWNRRGLDGKPRQLHIAESLECIDFRDFEPGVQHIEVGTLADCPFFKVEKLVPPCGATDPECFSIFSVLTGTVACGGREFVAGSFFLVPAGSGLDVEAASDSGARLLRIELPLHKSPASR